MENEDAQADETLTLSADGLFVYHTGEGDDVQGYLEYVDEYNDGNGRYDMYNRMGMWLEGFYLTPRILFIWEMTELRFLPEQRKIRQKRIRKVRLKTKTAWKKKSYVLMSNKRYTQGLRPLYNNSSWGRRVFLFRYDRGLYDGDRQLQCFK